MSIKQYIDELDKLNAEIKRNNSNNKILRARIKELESNIGEYLLQKGQHGLKYNGRAIIIENKEKRPPKKKKEKEQSVLSLLEEWGINDTQSAYAKLQDVQKGEIIEQKKIKFTKVSKV